MSIGLGRSRPPAVPRCTASLRSRVARAVVLAALLVAGAAAAARAAGRIAVGSKNFAESRLLAEMFARLIEARRCASKR